MRIVLLCVLVSGCSVLDHIAETANNPPPDNRVFLGSDAVRVKHRGQLDRYTCGREQLVCETVGSVYYCNCAAVSRVRTQP